MVEKIASGVVQIRGEVAFRVSAKVEKGTACKVAGVLNFKRSGKSQVWRLAEGDNPCDGMREGFDLVYEKPVEKSRAGPAEAELMLGAPLQWRVFSCSCMRASIAIMSRARGRGPEDHDAPLEWRPPALSHLPISSRAS